MKKICGIIFTSFFLGFFSISASANGPESVKVVSATPGVTYTLFDKKGEVKAGMELAVNSVVSSDEKGTAVLLFFDGTTLEIAPDSEVFLVDFTNSPTEDVTMFMLNSGTVKLETGDASKRKNNPIRVHTPQATIGIRGTSVIIQARDGKNHVYMTETSGKGIILRDKTSGDVKEVLTPGDVVTVGPGAAEKCTDSRCLLKQMNHTHESSRSGDNS